MKFHPVVYIIFMLVLGVIFLISHDLKILKEKMYELEMRVYYLEDLIIDSKSDDKWEKFNIE